MSGTKQNSDVSPDDFEKVPHAECTGCGLVTEVELLNTDGECWNCWEIDTDTNQSGP